MERNHGRSKILLRVLASRRPNDRHHNLVIPTSSTKIPRRRSRGRSRGGSRGSGRCRRSAAAISLVPIGTHRCLTFSVVGVSYVLRTIRTMLILYERQKTEDYFVLHCHGRDYNRGVGDGGCESRQTFFYSLNCLNKKFTGQKQYDRALHTKNRNGVALPNEETVILLKAKLERKIYSRHRFLPPTRRFV